MYLEIYIVYVVFGMWVFGWNCIFNYNVCSVYVCVKIERYSIYVYYIVYRNYFSLYVY